MYREQTYIAVYLNLNELKLLLNGLGHYQADISSDLEGYADIDDDGNNDEILRLQQEEKRIEKMRNKLDKNVMKRIMN